MGRRHWAQCDVSPFIMTNLEQILRRATQDLSSLSQRFAVVGGLAVSVRAEPRLTRDADLAVSVTSDRDAEAVVLGMQQLGYHVLAAVEQDRTGRLSTVRLARPGDEVSMVTDLLFASCGIENEIVEAADTLVVLPGLLLPTATIGHLIAMKLLARDDRKRPADADDLRALRAVANPADWEMALDAVGQIEQRGYARGRDLSAALSDLQSNDAY